MRNDLDLGEGSGAGPLQSVEEPAVEAEEVEEEAVTESARPEDLLGMEANQAENEVEVGGKRKKGKHPALKCGKCARKNYRGRNAAFCGECGAGAGAGQETSTPPSKLRLTIRCRRCQRKHFLARNSEFCGGQCRTVLDTTEPITTPGAANTRNKDDKKNNKKKNNKKNKMKKNQKNKKGGNKKNKNKKKKKDLKNKKPVVDMDEEEISMPSSILAEEPKLGPLENLIKFLVQSSTFHDQARKSGDQPGPDH